MGVRGDFSALRSLGHRIKSIDSPQFRDGLARRLIAAALKLWHDGFRYETDPYLNPWRKLKYREGRILQKTGNLRNSARGEPTADGFWFGTDVGYAIFHQEPTDPKRRRLMMPVKRRGLPGNWAVVFNKTARDFMAEWMRR